MEQRMAANAATAAAAIHAAAANDHRSKPEAHKAVKKSPHIMAWFSIYINKKRLLYVLLGLQLIFV